MSEELLTPEIAALLRKEGEELRKIIERRVRPMKQITALDLRRLIAAAYNLNL